MFYSSYMIFLYLSSKVNKYIVNGSVFANKIYRKYFSLLFLSDIFVHMVYMYIFVNINSRILNLVLVELVIYDKLY